MVSKCSSPLLHFYCMEHETFSCISLCKIQSKPITFALRQSRPFVMGATFTRLYFWTQTILIKSTFPAAQTLQAPKFVITLFAFIYICPDIPFGLFEILSNKVMTIKPDKDIIASIAWKRRHLMVRAVECSNHIELRILLRMRAHLYRCKWANLIWLSFYLFASCCYLFCYHLYKINVLHT